MKNNRAIQIVVIIVNIVIFEVLAFALAPKIWDTKTVYEVLGKTNAVIFLVIAIMTIISRKKRI